jgi:hypothetical protein
MSNRAWCVRLLLSGNKAHDHQPTPPVQELEAARKSSITPDCSTDHRQNIPRIPCSTLCPGIVQPSFVRSFRPLALSFVRSLVRVKRRHPCLSRRRHHAHEELVHLHAPREHGLLRCGAQTFVDGRAELVLETDLGLDDTPVVERWALCVRAGIVFGA